MPHWPKNLQERIEAREYFNLSELGRMFGRSRRAMHYYSTQKWLGVPRMRGGQKVYSLAIAEIFFREIKTPEQIDRALQTARSDNIVAIVEGARKLRDHQWTEALEKQGITDISPEAL